MELDLTFLRALQQEMEYCTLHLATHMSGTVRCTTLATSYHPLRWWTKTGAERCKTLAPFSYSVFSFSSSSVGVERSFKVSSRAHGKNRCQLSDTEPDKQSCIIFNSSQLRRIEYNALATRRGGSVFAFIVMGYNDFAHCNGLSLSELIITVHSDDAQPSEVDESEDV